MKTEPLTTPLIAEHERAQHLATLNRLADLVRAKGASEPSLHTLLTGFHEFLKITGTPTISPSDPSPQEAAIPLSHVTTQPLTWLWHERIPRGKLTLLDGEPGSGTSLLALTLAAHLSSGRPLPGTSDTATIPTPANVLLIAPHEDTADTIKPRFAAAGGDPHHLFLLNTVETLVTGPTVTMAERPFCLADDLALLEATIERLSAALVIIDPLHSIMGMPRSRSSSRRPSPRTLLFSLAQLAQRTGCAFLLIRHVKTSPSDLRHPRPSGSPDLVSAARSALLLLADPNDAQTHLLLPTKHPLCQEPAILAYQVVAHEMGVAAIHWLENWQPSASLQQPLAPTLSAQRQAILDYALQSLTPIGPRETSAHIGYDYKCVRKMMQRLFREGDLVSPARGLYTLPGHPCLLHPDAAPEILPTPSHVPNVSSNPNNEKNLNPLSNHINDPTHVANVPNETTITYLPDPKCSGDPRGQYFSNTERSMVGLDGRPQGPTQPILTPLAPTIRRSGPPNPCIVGAGEDVGAGMGPLWPPVRLHSTSPSPSLSGIDPLGLPDPSEDRFPSAIIPPRDDSPW